MSRFTFEALSAGYATLWDAMEPHADAGVTNVARRIVNNRKRYQAVADETGVPWYWIGITHNLECGGRFDQHLHNGDPLTRQTVRVPAGRPSGKGPFTWHESAVDALNIKQLSQVTDWSIERMAYEFERFNGFGYRHRRIHSPYLWSGSNHYSAGKYVADGVWSATAVSKQIGAMVLLREIMAMKPDAARVPGPIAKASGGRTVMGAIYGFAALAFGKLMEHAGTIADILPAAAERAGSIRGALSDIMQMAAINSAPISMIIGALAFVMVVYARLDDASKGKT